MEEAHVSLCMLGFMNLVNQYHVVRHPIVIAHCPLYKAINLVIDQLASSKKSSNKASNGQHSNNESLKERGDYILLGPRQPLLHYKTVLDIRVCNYCNYCNYSNFSHCHFLSVFTCTFEDNKLTIKTLQKGQRFILSNMTREVYTYTVSIKRL